MNENESSNDPIDRDIQTYAEFSSELEQLTASGQLDWFLAELVELAELGFCPYVVLTISGAHVSGRIIGASEYFSKLSALFLEASSDQEEDFVRAVSDRMKVHSDQNKRDEKVLGSIRRYIHLDDARFHTTDGKFLPENGAMQRFRLLAVDGFSFGKLHVR